MNGLCPGHGQKVKCQASCKTVTEYSVLMKIRRLYVELQQWIENGWLFPLMAVMQQNETKVCPLMDYRELKFYVDAYTADTVCASKRREWRCEGSNVALLDL